MQSLLAEHGIMPVQAGEMPDVCVVNTCSVTALADSKCRQHIRHLIRQYPDALMVVTGCYAQLKGKEIAEIPGVDIVLGSEHKAEIAKFVMQWFEDRQQQLAVTPSLDIRTFSPSCDRGDRTRYWLKVQDGCDYWCSYCTIPAARGRSRSGTIAQLVAQAREVAAEGGKVADLGQRDPVAERAHPVGAARPGVGAAERRVVEAFYVVLEHSLLQLFGQRQADRRRSGRHVLEGGGRRQAGGLFQLFDQLPGIEGVEEIDISRTSAENLYRQIAPVVHVNPGGLLIGVAPVFQFEFLHCFHSFLLFIS